MIKDISAKFGVHLQKVYSTAFYEHN